MHDLAQHDHLVQRSTLWSTSTGDRDNQMGTAEGAEENQVNDNEIYHGPVRSEGQQSQAHLMGRLFHERQLQAR